MKAFSRLYANLDRTNKTNRKVAALIAYFQEASPRDAAWAVYFLSGRKLPQPVPVRRLAAWTAEQAGVPDWLFEECYEVVGDLAETMALVLPENAGESERPLAEWVEQRLLPLRGLDEPAQREAIRSAWSELSSWQRFVWHKLLTGALRVGVSQRLLTRAIAEHAGLDTEVVAHRLMGDWEPTAEFFRELVHPDSEDTLASRPYPFLLAHPLEGPPSGLGDVGAWQAEWKWDGIRAQCIRRDGQLFIWSRGEELLTERFPELHDDLAHLPDGTVLDGEIVAWDKGRVLPFNVLQQRIGRKNVTAGIRRKAPVALLAFDLLEWRGEDLRPRPLGERRPLLEAALDDLPAEARVRPAEVLPIDGWRELAELRAESREHRSEGLMLKRLDSPYGVGRVRGDWWKWKIEPYTVDAVLIYAQRGSGRRASLYTDYTFALWQGDELVPFAKAYSGLTDQEIAEVDRFVRANTKEKFGPVRSVEPRLVFELAFENIQRSKRHRCGIAVRFPRIVRWRRDKQPADADTLEALRRHLPEAS